ncbi:hypothetical protein STEG23_018176, partial [Scotinomys teguina]
NTLFKACLGIRADIPTSAMAPRTKSAGLETEASVFLKKSKAKALSTAGRRGRVCVAALGFGSKRRFSGAEQQSG